MSLPSWYQTAMPRVEVRAGRSFNPDEFVIHLEQVVGRTAPDDYNDPVKFFARTSFTAALREHSTMVLRRLAGQTAQTAPVLTLVTQFGGGKTHTLAALYHLATAGNAVGGFSEIAALLRDAGLDETQGPPQARVASFVGNAWDPREGCETPWIDLARQISGEEGVRLLGSDAKRTPPGTESLSRVFDAANAPVLVLFDEVLNFINRHGDFAEQFHSFIQNLTGAMTAGTHRAAVISLPQSSVEMTPSDAEWHGRLTKVVSRVAKNSIANDEAEIGEVVRRRLFDSLGDEKTRRRVAKKYADWCFTNRHALPPEWTAIDSADSAGGKRRASERLQARFAACYPFHPATLSVFQRKWRALPQFQQTRATLAMLGQWISWAYHDDFKQAHTEPLLTIGSAPLAMRAFRSAVLGQLGEANLEAAITADIAGANAHSGALDADCKGGLRGIHRRVGTAILFESSGGQVEKVARLPELRFALGGPGLDIASIDNAAEKLEGRAYFLRKVGADGFKVSQRPTLRKVVYDRRAALDYEREVLPALHKIVRKQFDNNGVLHLVFFPSASQDIPDYPKLMLVVVEPEAEWDDVLREKLSVWTKQRGNSPRLYPGALVWAVKRPGDALREKVEMWLAWRRVALEVRDGTLGDEIEAGERNELNRQTREAERMAEESVWDAYCHIALYDSNGEMGLKKVDLIGHSGSANTMSTRVLNALTANALLTKTVGAGYLQRNWPPALRESGAWPLSGLRQSFLDGGLMRLADPDTVLRRKITEFVRAGEFGLASGAQGDAYMRVWYEEAVDESEVEFDADVYLLQKARAEALTAVGQGDAGRAPEMEYSPQGDIGDNVEARYEKPADDWHKTPGDAEGKRAVQQQIFVEGEVPSNLWNHLGALLQKLRGDNALMVSIKLNAGVDAARAGQLRGEFDELARMAKQLGGELRVKPAMGESEDK